MNYTQSDPDLETYNYYKSQYDAFSGNPDMQSKIVAAFYQENSPENKRKKQKQKELDMMMQQMMNPQSGGQGGFGMSLEDEVLARAGITPVQQQQTDMMTTEAPKAEPEGSFGFGTDKGNLFGEGGLVSSLTQPFRQGIIDPVASIVQTGGKVASDVLAGKPLGYLSAPDISNEARQLTQMLEAGKISKVQYDAGIESLRNKISPFTQNTALGNPTNAVENQQAFTTTQQEHNDYMSNPALGGVKSAVGIGSYAIPAGLGKVMTPATSVLGKAGQAALTSGLSSGSFGFGTSRPGEEVDRTLESLGTGVVLGGGLSLAGSALSKGVDALKGKTGKIPEAISKFGEGRQANATKRLVGTIPPKKVGGAGLIDIANARSKELGIAINSADDVLALSDDLYMRNGNKIVPALQQAQSTGAKFDSESIISELKKAAEKETYAPYKKAMLDAVEDIKSSFKNTGDDLVKTMDLNRSIGTMGKWKSVVDPNQSKVSELYEKAYMMIRDQLKQKSGLGTEFDKINKGLQDSINLKIWGQTANERVVPPASVSDMLQDSVIGGFLLSGGNPAGGVAGYAAGKITQSPQFERTLGKGAEKIASTLQNGKVNIPGKQMIADLTKKSAPLAQTLLGPTISSATNRTPTKTVSSVTNVTPAEIEALKKGEIAFYDTTTGLFHDKVTPNGRRASEAEMIKLNTNNTSTTSNQSGLNTDMLKQYLMMGLLSGDVDAATANAVSALLGDSGTPALTAKQKNDLTSLSVSEKRLARIDKMIADNPDYFSPANIGGRLRDSLGGLAADPARERIKAQLQEQLRNMVYELSGTAASDKERESINDQLPKPTDTVETSLQKLQVLKDTLNDKKLTYQEMGVMNYGL